MYNPKTYKINEDLEVIKILDTNELSPYSIATYSSILKQFTKCIGKTYSEIIHEIKALEGDKIVDNKIIRYNPNDNLINDYILQYIQYLKNRNNKKNTINIKITQLLVLLKKSKLQVPEISLKKEAQQKKVQLITTDDIRFVLSISNIHHKALMTFMASTGFRRWDVIHKFKIGDLIEACSDYVRAVFLDDFLKEAPDNMIPYFEFIPNKTKKTGLVCKGCCSTESTNLLIQSLKLRLKSVENHNRIHNTDLVLDEDCPLFTSKRGNYITGFHEKSISTLFHEKNKQLRKYKEEILDNQYRNHEITKKEWKHKKETMPKFHPHGLRHRFISTLRAYTTNRDVSLLMEGHASSINTDKYYIGESEELFNKESIRNTYKQVMPYLTFFQNIDPVTYHTQKEENNKLQSKVYSLEKRVDEFSEMADYLKKNSVLNDFE